MTENLLDNEVSIARRISIITEGIENTCTACGRSPTELRLMAVTKTVPPVLVNEAIAAGITLLGENRAQELNAKYDEYDKTGIDIHFIGRLQTNKVRQVIDKVSMIQSLDSIALAKEIQRQCEKYDKAIDCLVEVNIGAEASKSGVNASGFESFLESVSCFDRLHVRGIMSIPPFDVDDSEKERNFSNLYKLFVDIKAKKIDNIHMDFLSMGMSGDYLLAVKHGSNILRLGTMIFGSRQIGQAK